MSGLRGHCFRVIDIYSTEACLRGHYDIMNDHRGLYKGVAGPTTLYIRVTSFIGFYGSVAEGNFSNALGGYRTHHRLGGQHGAYHGLKKFSRNLRLYSIKI